MYPDGYAIGPFHEFDQPGVIFELCMYLVVDVKF